MEKFLFMLMILKKSLSTRTKSWSYKARIKFNNYEAVIEVKKWANRTFKEIYEMDEKTVYFRNF